MQGSRNSMVAAMLGLGVALVVSPFPAPAEGDGALRGPVVAIEKARAAAAKEEQRARQHDAQAEATVADDAPRATSKTKSSTTAGSGSAEVAPQDQEDGAAETATGESVDPPTYDVAAHRDPFRPPRLSGVIDARTPLQTYQLGQLKLVGVIAQPSQGFRAMVEDSAGLGYIITTGTPIGSSGGVVRSIEPRRVVIEESTRDFYGDVKPKEVVMELPQEDRSP